MESLPGCLERGLNVVHAALVLCFFLGVPIIAAETIISAGLNGHVSVKGIAILAGWALVIVMMWSIARSGIMRGFRV